ncbi:hypothetical protein BKA66DRAFT_575983 [Pyrenochaeta sp. MPI-SDFR-AT-0127]|nr:hypothetical protein BKA66DRAFT_575983 [Pyrenochaeta sp. MPI-SDFR-AT-0127]
MNRFILLALYSQLFISASIAQSRFCNNVRTYLTYNATKTAPITGLKHEIGSSGQPRVIPDDEQSWNLTARLWSTTSGPGTGSAVTEFFIDTGKTNTANMGLCIENAPITFNSFFLFSEKVLRRAAQDKGDCKTMFGVQCVNALKRHFSIQAIEYARKGECPTIEYGFNSTAAQNQTVPWECASFLDGDDEWNGELIPDTGNLTANLATIYDQPICDVKLPGELPPTVHTAGAVGGSYNNSVRIPTPTFFTFFPNYTFPGSDATFNFTLTPEDIHVEVVCITPTEIEAGSFTPPSAEELLGPGAEFHENVTDPRGANEPDPTSAQRNQTGNGTGSGVTPSQSTAGVAPMQTLGPLLGTGIGLAALLFI